MESSGQELFKGYTYCYTIFAQCVGLEAIFEAHPSKKLKIRERSKFPEISSFLKGVLQNWLTNPHKVQNEHSNMYIR